MGGTGKSVESPALATPTEAGCQTKSAATLRSDEPCRCSDAPDALVGTPSPRQPTLAVAAVKDTSLRNVHSRSFRNSRRTAFAKAPPRSTVSVLRTPKNVVGFPSGESSNPVLITARLNTPPGPFVLNETVTRS